MIEDSVLDPIFDTMSVYSFFPFFSRIGSFWQELGHFGGRYLPIGDMSPSWGMYPILSKKGGASERVLPGARKTRKYIVLYSHVLTWTCRDLQKGVKKGSKRGHFRGLGPVGLLYIEIDILG